MMRQADMATWSLQRLESLLESYGSDAARWPEGAAAGIEAFLKHEPKARTLMSQARALDRLLATAPEPAHARQGQVLDQLMGRIAAEAAAARPVRANAEVVPLRPRSHEPRAPIIGTRRTMNAAAALLAASLMIGLGLGATGVARPTLPGLGASQLAELDADIAHILASLPSELAGLSDEEML